ncbi:MAG: hypothetical protein IJ561_00680 [Ruminococcus sp.]|nr:hypothetical protein [Ruminococcus sp.]
MIAAITVLLITLTALAALCYGELKRTPTGLEGYVVIPCNAETADLEQTVKEAYHTERRNTGSQRRIILIVLISAGENTYKARRLALELEGVEAIDITALADRVRRGR